MNDLISKITNAIFRQEGMGPTYRNPGNLRGAPWLHGTPYSVVPMAGGFWAPTSRAQGVAGAAHVVALHIAQGDSLEALITRWAPSSDGNDTQAYIANVALWSGIPDVKLPLWNFIQDAPVT